MLHLPTEQGKLKTPDVKSKVQRICQHYERKADVHSIM